MTVRRDRTLLAVVVAAVLFAQVLLYPGIGDLVTALGATTELDAGMWFLAAEFGAFVVCVPVWGAVSDATGKRVPWIVLGAAGAAIGYATLAVLPAAIDLTFTGVLLLRVVQGAATIGAFSLAITMLMDLEGGHGKNMGAAGIAIGVGTALGAPVGGQLSELDPIAPLGFAALLLAAVALLVTLVEDRAPASDRSPREALAVVRRTPPLVVPYAFGLIDRFTAGFFALVGTLYFQDAFGLGPGDTGLVLMAFFAPFALLQYPMGALSDRIGRTIPVVAGSLCYGVGVIAVGVAPSIALAAAGMVLVGVLGALVAPATMALVTDLADPTDRGGAMAGFNLFGSVGFLGGFLLGGTVADASGYEAAFLVAGSLEIAIALIAAPAFLRLSLGRPTAASAD
ncbi:major facilitator superfamily protein [Salinarchaeum sp. Harcht-Bsk1]|uniref:MFS transporter n=1 Tax=Salinarchaeum sp. Harcht-Bsk1 TaxID=1333523 RepID=UPI0003424566|nr:MFS transporter [Salinarchaeum sp. Harcht-Bsk1]AGN00617.1 major facilitator superfamily protein [Salinarchaeum sp. Harcht-Bsk1]